VIARIVPEHQTEILREIPAEEDHGSVHIACLRQKKAGVAAVRKWSRNQNRIIYLEDTRLPEIIHLLDRGWFLILHHIIPDWRAKSADQPIRGRWMTSKGKAYETCMALALRNGHHPDALRESNPLELGSLTNRQTER